MNLEEYTQYRTGSTKISLIIRNMFLKPFTSSSLRSFWKYWNPSWGYFLLFYCYKPIRVFLPNWASLIITFLISGLFHDMRSEEHTSELQSRPHLVCRLLLEKKKIIVWYS